jgi:hypothetical protein
MKPDREIFEVEQRIAQRRAELKQVGRMTGHVAMQKLVSPISLVAVAGLGFVLGGGVGRRQASSQAQAAGKATGIAGLVLTAALWAIRARFGSTAGLAHYVLSKIPQRRKTSVVAQRQPYG